MYIIKKIKYNNKYFCKIDFTQKKKKKKNSEYKGNCISFEEKSFSFPSRLFKITKLKTLNWNIKIMILNEIKIKNLYKYKHSSFFNEIKMRIETIKFKKFKFKYLEWNSNLKNKEYPS